MKKRITKWMSSLLVAVMLISVMNVPIKAAEGDLVDQMIDQLYATQFKNEFFDLFNAFQQVNDPQGLSNAYASAFGALASSQQARIESFGVSVELVRILADKVNDAQVSEVVLRRWLSADTPEYRTKLREFIESKAPAILALGDTSRILYAMDRMNVAFKHLNKIRIFANDRGLNFAQVDASHKNMTLLEEQVPVLVDFINIVLEDDISDIPPVVEALKVFPIYYNNADADDQKIVYDYLYTYHFVRVLEAANPGGNVPGGNAGGVTGGNAGGGNAGGNGNGRINADEIDIYDEETAQGLNFIVVTLTQEQLELFGKKTITTVNGEEIAQLTFEDADAFADILSIASPKLRLLIEDEIDGVDIRINGAIIEMLGEKDGSLFIETKIGTYELDGKKLAAQFAEELGKDTKSEDVTVRVRFSKVKGFSLSAVETAIRGNQLATLVGTPMNYKLSFILGEEETELSTLPMFIERRMIFDEATMATAALMINGDGTTQQVPVRIFEEDGVWYAAINSRNNGTFALTKVTRGFKDITGHWAMEMIQELADRLMINGVDVENFQPQRQITRAEMATILVNALGLSNTLGEGFTDVTESDWYYEAVMTAKNYGLISGYDDNSFKPNKHITREEAMVMIANAIQLINSDTSVSGSMINLQLSQFTDSSSISEWAKSKLALVVSEGVASGSNGLIRPKDHITRAEVVALIYKMLQEAGLL